MAGDTTPPGEWQNAIPATAVTVEVTAESTTTVEKLQDVIDDLLSRVAELEDA